MTETLHNYEPYAGFKSFDTLIHPDYEGTFYPWKTPHGLLQEGKMLLQAVEGHDIITADIARVQLWEVVHPSWCKPSGTCDSTEDVGAVMHRRKVLAVRSKAGEAVDADVYEAHDFTARVTLEEIADSAGRAGATLRVSFAGEIADGSFAASPEQLRYLAHHLGRAADAAIKHQDLDYQPRR